MSRHRASPKAPKDWTPSVPPAPPPRRLPTDRVATAQRAGRATQRYWGLARLFRTLEPRR